MTERDRGRWRDIGGAVWWRQVRSDAWADLVIAVVVAMTAFVVAMAPRVLAHAASRDLAETMTSATPEQRNLRFDSLTEIGAGPPTDPFLNVDLHGGRLRRDHVPDSVAELLTGEQWVVDTPDFVVASYPDEIRGPFPTTFRLRYQEGIDERAQLVSGRAPTAQTPIHRLEGPECPEGTSVAEFTPDEDVDCAVVAVPVLEAAVTRETADDMMVEVGDMVMLRPSTSDLSFRTIRVDASSLRFAMRISGIVALDDEHLPYWYADRSLHRPSITENADYRLVYAVGLMSPDQYRVIRHAAPGVAMNHSWRYFVDPELVADADAAQLRNDVARIAPPDVDVVTLLPDLLGEHLGQRRLATVLLSLSAVGVVAAALTSIWVLASVDGLRRRSVTSLLTDRGASRPQLAMHAARTATLVTVPVAFIASVVAWALLPDTGSRTAVSGVIGVLLAASAVVARAGTPMVPRLDRESRRMRRIVAETLVVATAVGAIVLVRRRGSSVEGAIGGGFDATLAIAPALTSLAAGVLTLRVIGPIAAGMSWVASRRREAAWFVGARRLAGQPTALRTPVAGVAIAAAGAVFATIVWSSLGHHRELASWQSVGGEIRVETTNPDIPLSSRLQAELDRWTPAYGVALGAQRFDGPADDFIADVVAVDTSAFEAVVGDEILADAIDASVDVLRDGGGGAIPALLIADRSGGSAPRVGDVAALESGAFVVPFEFVGVSERFPGVAGGRRTIVVDRARLGASTDPRTVEPTFALLGAGAEIDDGLRSVLDDPRVFASATSRSDRLASIAGDPLASWTVRSMWLLGVAALGLAVVTAAAGAVITAAWRRRDLGLMAVLGLERRAAARVVAIELLPGVFLAAAAGAVAGALTARLIGPNLSIGALTGGSGPAGVIVEWPTFGSVVGLLAISTGLAVAATVRSLGRVDHAKLLRRGDL